MDSLSGKVQMKRIFFASVVSLTLAGAGAASAEVFPGSSWATKSPADVDLDVSYLQTLANEAGGNGMVVRHGYQVFTWGNPSTQGDWASASKPMLSTLLLRAASQGLCTVDTNVGTYLSGTTKDEAITFRHLANMVSGYSRSESAGTAWAYNDVAINLYGKVLFEEVFGDNAPTVFAQEFAFMNFQDSYSVSDWQYGRIKSMSVRDFARFGLFWLNRGTWGATEIIPSSYFDLLEDEVPAATPVTSGDGPESWNFGTFGGDDNQTASGPGTYAMNFWTNQGGSRWPGFPSDVFHANGHWNQKVCWVIPSLDLVVVGYGTNSMFGEADALQLLFDADQSTVSVDAQTWSETKALYR